MKVKELMDILGKFDGETEIKFDRCSPIQADYCFPTGTSTNTRHIYWYDTCSCSGYFVDLGTSYSIGV